MSERIGSPERKMSLCEAMTKIGWPVTGDASRDAERAEAFALVHAELTALARRMKRTGKPCDQYRDDFASAIVIRMANSGGRPEGTFKDDEAARGFLVVYLWNAWRSCWRRCRRESGIDETEKETRMEDIFEPLTDASSGADAEGDPVAELARAHETIRASIVREECAGMRSDGAAALRATLDWLYEVRADASAFDRTADESAATTPRKEADSDARHRKRVRDKLHQRCHRAIKDHLIPWVAGNEKRGRITPRDAQWLRRAIDELRPFDRKPPSRGAARERKERR